MNVSSINYSPRKIFSLDEILQDIPETATEGLLDSEKTYQSYKEELNLELKTTDRVWLEFHAGQCEQFGKAAKSMLYRIVKSSVDNPENSVAAANAITILKVMRVSFSCLDLRGIQIPGAELSSVILDRADLSSANLESVNLRNASLNGTNMSKADLKKVKFDISDILIHDGTVFSSIVSSDNKYLISEDSFYMYFWYLPSENCMKKIQKLSNHYVSEKIFTPDGQFLFVYDGEKNLDIWSVGDFRSVKRLKISHKEIAKMHFSFSQNGTHLFTYNQVPYYQASRINQGTHLKHWKIQITDNSLLDISLKNEVMIFDQVSKIQFSKKFSVFYCLKTEFTVSDVKACLSIWSIEKLFQVINIPIISRSRPRSKYYKGWSNKLFALDILNTNRDDKELLFIAISSSIYSINILKKNSPNWTLESTPVTEVTTDSDAILDMQILEKTDELIYLCNDAVCLYSIKNNQCIGKFRLLDTRLKKLVVSRDRTLYINRLNEVFIHTIEALKNSGSSSYQINSRVACFSPDMHSIMSISNSFYMTVYEIETGNLLKSYTLQKIKSHVSNEIIGKVLFSPNAQHILVSSVFSRFSDYDLSIVNTKNEEICTYLKTSTADRDIFVISNNSEYLALIDSEKTLAIYKTASSRQYIGKFNFESSRYSQIAISTDFHNTPRVALIDKSNKVIVCNFVFKAEVLELLDQKELLVPIERNEVLQLVFIENDSKLIIACKERIIIWDIARNHYKKYDIKANCVGVSHDGSLLIYCNWNKYDLITADHQLCLWSNTQKKPLIVQSLSLAITKLQISPDNRYIIGTTENGGMYVWKIIEGTFRLLWRTSHNFQTQGLILGDNNLEKDIEEELLTKMSAIKL